MEDKKTCQDLEEDEELASLRLAALATLKNRSSKKPEPEAAETNTILTINSIPRTADYSSDHTSNKNKHPWRKNAQSLRRGRNFTKPSQRSNLIVITPVGGGNKSSSEMNSATQLLLPQHKWCQQSNEDSSSPKVDRRTGPSRFNRRGSGSETSDSDYAESDDSYSNETVLQDEHSRLTADEDHTVDAELKNCIGPERRLSFQNLETNLNLEPTSKSDTDVFSCADATYPSSQTDVKPDSQEIDLSTIPQPQISSYNFTNHVTNSEENKLTCLGEESPIPRNSDTVMLEIAVNKASKEGNKHPPIKFDASTISDHKKIRKMPISDQKDKSLDSSHVFKDLRNHLDATYKTLDSSEFKTSSLSENDLRFELKKRKANLEKAIFSDRKKSSGDKLYPQNKNRLRNQLRSWSRDRSISRERRSSKRSPSPNQKRTPKRKRGRGDRGSFSSSGSRSSSSSSSSSSSVSSCNDSCSKSVRSISSVVQPVQSKVVVTESQNNLKSSIGGLKSYISSSDADHHVVKRAKGIEIKLKPLSQIKISVPGNDRRTNAPEIKKRGPVHMRLGTLPRKRVIKMPKDVEAAFVSTSSDEDMDVNVKCKKPNILVVTEMCGDKMEGRHTEKKVLQKSDVPKVERGRVLR